jgi:hypothetical protein
VLLFCICREGENAALGGERTASSRNIAAACMPLKRANANYWSKECCCKSIIERSD